MSLVRFDHLPPELTDGERAALASANERGWIVPPLHNSLHPEPPRPWRTAHCRYLQRRGFIGQIWRRLDGVFCWRLNDDGRALARDLVAQPMLREAA